MAQEKIEDVSNEILLKRKKFITFLVGIYIGVLVVWIGLIIYDIIKNGEISKSAILGGTGALATFWIPLLMFKKVNDEFKRRADK